MKVAPIQGATEAQQKDNFKDFVETIGNFFDELARGPRADRNYTLPVAFTRTNFIVRKRVNGEKLIYVEVLNGNRVPAEGDTFFSYNIESERACELEVISTVGNWILSRNKTCQRFNDIAPGDYLVPKTVANEQIWRRRYSNDYLALWIQKGNTDMSIAGTDYNGSNFRYGARVAMDLSSISRAQLNYGVGRNDLSKASSGVEGGFQGNALSSLHVLGRWSERWQQDYEDFTLIPMVGVGTFFEDLQGHPKVRVAGGGITGGFLLKSDVYKTIIDGTLSYCLIGCQATEAGRTTVAEYPNPEILELRVSAKSEILPWSGFGLLTFIEYYSVSAKRAHVTSETLEGRNFKDNYLGFGLGLTYSWK